MIKIMKGNSRLAGQIDERQDEECKCDNKENRNAVLVRDVKTSAHKSHDDQQSRNDGTHRTSRERGLKARTIESGK